MDSNPCLAAKFMGMADENEEFHLLVKSKKFGHKNDFLTNEEGGI